MKERASLQTFSLVRERSSSTMRAGRQKASTSIIVVPGVCMEYILLHRLSSSRDREHGLVCHSDPICPGASSSISVVVIDHPITCYFYISFVG